MVKYFSNYKYLALVVVILLSFIYAIPNIFGYKPIIQISCMKEDAQCEKIYPYIQLELEKRNIKIQKKIYKKNDLLVFFYNTNDQLLSEKVIKNLLGKDFNITMNLIPDIPNWLKLIYAYPMKLGLDLKGGIYFLVEIDTLSNNKNSINNYYYKITNFLYKKKLQYINLKFSDKNIYIHFKNITNLENSLYFLKKQYPEIEISKRQYKNRNYLQCYLKKDFLLKNQEDIIEKTLSILRNRINELGIAETIVRKQGKNKISIQLPGVQDINKAKKVLGKIATLEFLLHNDKHNVSKTILGKIPFDSKLLYEKNGKPWVLKKKVILSGKNIIHAKVNYDEYNKPIILVKLGGDINKFKNITKKNIGKRLAIVYKEIKSKNPDKKIEKNDFFVKEYIVGIPIIQEALRDSFQISGLNKEESQQLSILLRAGSLPASLKIVEEKIIGPSMGSNNIKLGLQSLLIGLILILVFMCIVYGFLGIVADIALILNLILIVAIMSILNFTLTLPGIAGIILTLGMSIDANVLVFERIKEEIKCGTPKRVSIIQGYKKAFTTVLDANITTLIVGVVLFLFSTGPVKGFAITLSIGILTSIFTAIHCTQAIIYVLYGSKKDSWIFLGFRCEK